MLDTFYFKTIRIVAAQFADLVNNVELQRFDDQGNTRETITVPLKYSPRKSFIARLNGIDTTDNNTDIQSYLPAMSYEIDNIQYNPERKVNTMNRQVEKVSGDRESNLKQLAPVPYDINLRLSVHSNRINDVLQMVEQILPWFTPRFNLNINDMPEMEYETDVPVIVKGVTSEDNYPDGFTNSRFISWHIDFVAEANLYPPLRDTNIITEATINYYEYTTQQLLENFTYTENE